MGYFFPSKYDFPDTTGSTFCCLPYSYLQLDFKMSNRLFSLTVPPSTFRQKFKTGSAPIKYDTLDTKLHGWYCTNYALFYSWEIFFNIVCGNTEIMNSSIKSNVSRVPGGTPNICACVTGFFVFWDEPHHIRLSTMIKSNMYAHGFYAKSVNIMLLRYLDFVKSGVPQMKQELNKRISNIITATSV